MKKTLLALMLVSSLFVISCGADSTKPKDAYKSQSTEIETGTTIGYANNLTPGTGVVDVSTFASAGEKVTEIVQVTTPGTGTKTTNTVSAITKNTDGGIYQFTISDTTAQSATVTYKYSKKAALPMIEKEITGAYSGGSGSLTITINDNNFIFNKTIVSVTDKNGKQLTEYTDYSFDNNKTVVITSTTGYIAGDTFTVRYAYGDITKMSEKPLTGTLTSANTTVTIQLDVAANAGKSYYLMANIKENLSSGGIQAKEIQENKIVPSTGTITISAPTTGSWTKIDSCTYELWVY